MRPCGRDSVLRHGHFREQQLSESSGHPYQPTPTIPVDYAADLTLQVG